MELTHKMNIGYEQFRTLQWVKTARDLSELRQTIKLLEQQETQLTDYLKQLSNNNDFSAGGYTFTTYYRKGVIDYTKIPHLQGLDLEHYRKPTVQIWKLEKIEE